MIFQAQCIPFSLARSFPLFLRCQTDSSSCKHSRVLTSLLSCARAIACAMFAPTTRVPSKLMHLRYASATRRLHAACDTCVACAIRGKASARCSVWNVGTPHCRTGHMSSMRLRAPPCCVPVLSALVRCLTDLFSSKHSLVLTSTLTILRSYHLVCHVCTHHREAYEARASRHTQARPDVCMEPVIFVWPVRIRAKRLHDAAPLVCSGHTAGHVMCRACVYELHPALCLSCPLWCAARQTCSSSSTASC